MRRTTYDVVRSASFVTGVRASRLTDNRRTHDLIAVKTAIALIARQDLKRPLPMIGRVLNRHHTSVLHLIRAHGNRSDVAEIAAAIRVRMREPTWMDRLRSEMEAANARPSS